MKLVRILGSTLLLIILISCNNDKEISQLLTSKNKNDIIAGAYRAGESANKKFIPLLLDDSDDIRTSTSMKFKGISVYQSKMIALKKIFKVNPPNRITNIPDSTVIKFYMDLNMKNTNLFK